MSEVDGIGFPAIPLPEAGTRANSNVEETDHNRELPLEEATEILTYTVTEFVDNLRHHLATVADEDPELFFDQHFADTFRRVVATLLANRNIQQMFLDDFTVGRHLTRDGVQHSVLQVARIKAELQQLAPLFADARLVKAGLLNTAIEFKMLNSYLESGIIGAHVRILTEELEPVIRSRETSMALHRVYITAAFEEDQSTERINYIPRMERDAPGARAHHSITIVLTEVEKPGIENEGSGVVIEQGSYYQVTFLIEPALYTSEGKANLAKYLNALGIHITDEVGSDYEALNDSKSQSPLQVEVAFTSLEVQAVIMRDLSQLLEDVNEAAADPSNPLVLNNHRTRLQLTTNYGQIDSVLDSILTPYLDQLDLDDAEFIKQQQALDIDAVDFGPMPSARFRKTIEEVIDCLCEAFPTFDDYILPEREKRKISFDFEALSDCALGLTTIAFFASLQRILHEYPLIQVTSWAFMLMFLLKSPKLLEIFHRTAGEYPIPDESYRRTTNQFLYTEMAEDPLQDEED
jgi:hypothetical protein